jgi:hypothetical protein
MHPHRSHKDTNSHHGMIRDVFGHRFVLTTDDGTILADVGAGAPEGVRLKVGAKVKITGKKTPSEIKVRLFQSGSGETIEIPHKPKQKHPHKDGGDPEAAVRAALDAGYIVEGEPKRKPKHFELQAIRGGHHYELHIMLNGDIRKEIPLHK